MKLFGVLAVCLASFLALLRRLKALRAEKETAEELCRALELMSSELSERLCPLMELFGLLRNLTRGETAVFFTRLSASLEAAEPPSFPLLWREAAEKSLLSLSPAAREALRPLGQLLGRYELSEQLEGLRRALSQLERERERLRERYPERRKLSCALLTALACFLCLMLI